MEERYERGLWWEQSGGKQSKKGIYLWRAGEHLESHSFIHLFYQQNLELCTGPWDYKWITVPLLKELTIQRQRQEDRESRSCVVHVRDGSICKGQRWEPRWGIGAGHVSSGLMVKEEGFPANRSACAQCGTVESQACSGLSLLAAGCTFQGLWRLWIKGKIGVSDGKASVRIPLCTLGTEASHSPLHLLFNI